MDPGTLLVAEQAISTTVEATALASIGLAQKTQPLSATFTRISSAAFLPRSSHTLSVVSGRAYIFGGRTETGALASNDVHIVTLPLKTRDEAQPDYQCVPALRRGEDGERWNDEVPSARAGHGAWAIGTRIYVFGGFGADGEALDEGGRIWVFDTTLLNWSHVDPEEAKEGGGFYPAPRFDCGFTGSEHPLPPGADGKLKVLGAQIQDKISKTIPAVVSPPSPPSEPHGTLFVVGGLSSPDSDPVVDAWAFTIATRTWLQLPAPPLNPSSSPSIALANDTLYLITSTSSLSSSIHFLPVSHTLHPSPSDPLPPSWQTLDFPTNPLVPGPRPRKGAGFLSITTGNGRLYLLYFLGEKDPSSSSSPSSSNTAHESKDVQGRPAMFWSDMFSFQPLASELSPARVKDSTRETIGVSSGNGTWAEVKVVANEEAGGEGKSHMGPRGWFACDVVGDGTVLLWGGLDGRGTEGDGWILGVR